MASEFMGQCEAVEHRTMAVSKPMQGFFRIW